VLKLRRRSFYFIPSAAIIDPLFVIANRVIALMTSGLASLM
jgi:hypothetical protein